MTAPQPGIAGRLAPELRHLADARIDLSDSMIGPLRSALDGRRSVAAAALDASGVFITDTVVPDGPDVRIYRGHGPSSPAVVFCHSGAFVLGNLDIDHRLCVELARRASCTVVSVDYRLAPEHPHPAGITDALTALDWVVAEADSLDVDAQRVAVAGSSAGGALAAALAQQAAAGSAPPIVFQLLHQPVLDDRPTPSKAEFDTTPGFDGPACGQMWRHLAGGVHVPVDAVPARTDALEGVAPALITCSELDPLRDEAIDYALRLMWAGVPVELHAFPGTCHGFDSLLPDWDVSQELFAMQGAALRRALHP